MDGIGEHQHNRGGKGGADVYEPSCEYLSCSGVCRAYKRGALEVFIICVQRLYIMSFITGVYGNERCIKGVYTGCVI